MVDLGSTGTGNNGANGGGQSSPPGQNGGSGYGGGGGERAGGTDLLCRSGGAGQAGGRTTANGDGGNDYWYNWNRCYFAGGGRRRWIYLRCYWRHQEAVVLVPLMVMVDLELVAVVVDVVVEARQWQSRRNWWFRYHCS